MTPTDDINAILTAAGVPDTIERGGPGPDSGDSVEATTADRVRWLVADRDNAREDAQEYGDHLALCVATLEAAGIPKTYGIPGTATTDDPALTTRSDSVNAMIARLVAERDAARARLARVVPVIEALAAACDNLSEVCANDEGASILYVALNDGDALCGDPAADWSDSAASYRALIADEVPRG